VSLRIGQLAAKTEVTADTLRYYERLGLLPAPARTASGYRQYPDGAVMRVRLIRNAVRFGFALKDVARFLHVRDAGGVPCRQVRDYAQQLATEIDTRIRELVAMRQSMDAVLQEWDERLAHTPSGSRAHLLETLPRRPSAIHSRRGRW
jgi:DNA-binding transcriptional MerR regulator